MLRVAVVVGVQHMSLRVAGEGLRLGLAVVFSAAHEPGRSGWGRGVPCRPEPSDPPRHPPTRLACAGLGCEDALTHLLNYVFPNVFEVSPHIIQVRHPCSLALCLPACAFVHCSVRARVCASHARTPFPSTLLNALQTRLDLPLPHPPHPPSPPTHPPVPPTPHMLTGHHRRDRRLPRGSGPRHHPQLRPAGVLARVYACAGVRAWPPLARVFAASLPASLLVPCLPPFLTYHHTRSLPAPLPPCLPPPPPPAGPVPPGAQGARGVLAAVQQLVHRRPGGAGGLPAAHGGRRHQHLPPPRDGRVRLNPAPRARRNQRAALRPVHPDWRRVGV